MVHFSWGLTFRYVLVNSHLIHPPSNSWLLTLGILQTYPLSESFMIDFLQPYIHRLIDQPPLNHNRQKLISCHCTSGSFQEKKSGPFLVWYFIPGPILCPGTLTHCMLDFWKIVFFKKRTEPPGKKRVVQRRMIMLSCWIRLPWSAPFFDHMSKRVAIAPLPLSFNVQHRSKRYKAESDRGWKGYHWLVTWPSLGPRAHAFPRTNCYPRVDVQHGSRNRSSHSATLPERLDQPLSHSGRAAEWLSGWSSLSGRVAEWLV